MKANYLQLHFFSCPALMIPVPPGVHSVQHPAHSHPPALGGEALQVQALRQSLRFARRPRQPRAAHAQQGQGLHLLRVRPALPPAGGLQLPHEDSCCSLVRNPTDVSWTSSLCVSVCVYLFVRGCVHSAGGDTCSGSCGWSGLWTQGTSLSKGNRVYPLMPLCFSSRAVIS